MSIEREWGPQVQLSGVCRWGHHGSTTSWHRHSSGFYLIHFLYLKLLINHFCEEKMIKPFLSFLLGYFELKCKHYRGKLWMKNKELKCTSSASKPFAFYKSHVKKLIGWCVPYPLYNQSIKIIYLMYICVKWFCCTAETDTAS